MMRVSMYVWCVRDHSYPRAEFVLKISSLNAILLPTFYITFSLWYIVRVDVRVRYGTCTVQRTNNMCMYGIKID